MTAQARLTLFSPAKINVYLRILGQRADGYHDLETVMLPLDFGDKITLQLRKTSTAMECDNPQLPVDDTNLAVRAANAMAQAFNIEQGIKITLQKRIPLAAGLGGGSGNAATVITGLNELWRIKAPLQQLDPVAASLGSDINFFLHHQAALCRSRGEQVEPIPCRLTASILLINPGFGISTKWAYASWAKAVAGPDNPPDVTLLLQALANDDLAGVSRALFNSLEAPSIRKYPVLGLLKDALRAGGATGALMSGSGATVFGLFADTKAAARTAQTIREQFGPSLWTQVTRFSSPA